MTKHEHVGLGLMVGNEDATAYIAEMTLGVLNLECDASHEGHHVLEATGGGPLSDGRVADEPQDDGDEDAVKGVD